MTMGRGMWLGLWALALPTMAPAQQSAPTIFEDDFEGDLARWVFPKGAGHELVESGHPDRGTVLRLQTHDRLVVALMRGSEEWGDVRVEGEVLFPFQH